ncbi:hypothetical protein [Bacillus subtilis]|uniref:Uncharacterized protein n=1 Tax=Bacillus subtilis subsp. subtilis TaxID=135461 RepID=A0ABD4A021_BACIU|nr:hypothetical protein [Bacillus subtilis]KIL33460.1 hypothetical protein B4067_4679 [Bacillus subtilis subsp. subtilis]KIN59286.1 hypothetical protein B4145_4528 [Bacillus subtilis]
MFVSKKEYDKLKDHVEKLEHTVFNMGVELEKLKDAKRKEEPTVYFS